jgi:hypothetical protein
VLGVGIEVGLGVGFTVGFGVGLAVGFAVDSTGKDVDSPEESVSQQSRKWPCIVGQQGPSRPSAAQPGCAEHSGGKSVGEG